MERAQDSEAIDEASLVGPGHEPMMIRLQLDAGRWALERLAEIRKMIGSDTTRPAASTPERVTPQPPEGATRWLTPVDVMQLLQCSKRLAQRYVRAAAGRSIGTGRLLRVPIDAWEAWAATNLIDGRRQMRWEQGGRRERSISTGAAEFGGAGSTKREANSSGEAAPLPTKRRRVFASQSTSERPLIRPLGSRKA
jgi:hypothetical protein